MTEKKPRRSADNPWRTFHTRLLWTLAMIFSFFFVVASGHLYCALLVLAICTGSYNEIARLRMNKDIEAKLPVLWRLQVWYWYAIPLMASLYNMIGSVFVALAGREIELVRWVVSNHTFLSYLAIVTGVILCLLSIRLQHIKYQMMQLCIYVLAGIVVIAQGTSHVRIIHQGLIWFFLASTSVIANDIAAYLCGCAWGKTKLIPALSPKKTLEGFLGASIVTFIWAIAVVESLSYVKCFTAPQNEIVLRPFDMWRRGSYVVPQEFEWKTGLLFGQFAVPYKPAWIHAIILAFFASFVAPFGGLLASAYKRTNKVKDFANMIPGHGGVTDRFDCQLLMGTFTFLYLRSFCHGHRKTAILSRILRLDNEDKMEVFCELAAHLGQSVAPGICTTFLGHPLPTPLESVQHTRVKLSMNMPWSTNDQFVQKLSGLRHRLRQLKGVLDVQTRLLPILPSSNTCVPPVIWNAVKPYLAPSVQQDARDVSLRPEMICLCSACDELRHHLFKWEWKAASQNLSCNGWLSVLLAACDGGLRELQLNDASSFRDLALIDNPTSLGELPVQLRNGALAADIPADEPPPTQLLARVASRWRSQSLPPLDQDSEARKVLCEEIRLAATIRRRRSLCRRQGEQHRVKNNVMSAALISAFVCRSIQDMIKSLLTCLFSNAGTLQRVHLRGPVFSNAKVSRWIAEYSEQLTESRSCEDLGLIKDEFVYCMNIKPVERHTWATYKTCPLSKDRLKMYQPNVQIFSRLISYSGPVIIASKLFAPRLQGTEIDLRDDHEAATLLTDFLNRHPGISIMTLHLLQTPLRNQERPEFKKLVTLRRLKKLFLDSRGRSGYLVNMSLHILPSSFVDIIAPSLECLIYNFGEHYPVLRLPHTIRHLVIKHYSHLPDDLTRRHPECKASLADAALFPNLELLSTTLFGFRPFRKRVPRLRLLHLQMCKSEADTLARLRLPSSLSLMCNEISSLKMLVTSHKLLDNYQEEFYWIESLALTTVPNTVDELNRIVALFGPRLKQMILDVREMRDLNVEGLEGPADIWIITNSCVLPRMHCAASCVVLTRSVFDLGEECCWNRSESLSADRKPCTPVICQEDVIDEPVNIAPNCPACKAQEAEGVGNWQVEYVLNEVFNIGHFDRWIKKTRCRRC